jgi:protein-disulfide isomerase
MEKTNLIAVGAVVALGGFIVGRFDGKSHQAPAVVAAAAAPAVAAGSPTPEPAPQGAPKPAAEQQVAAVAPTPEPSKPSAPSVLDAQSDEGAGKGVDLSKLGVSPKDGSPYIGTKDAIVVVNVFSDFQCPVCKRSADPIKQLAADFPGKVKVYFRNNALEMHGRSKPAALAALAAKKQGKFWQYHDKLFASGQLDDASLEQTAKDLGLNIEQWKKDMADPKASERLAQESKWAEAMGATGTPGFFVNGVRQVGWGSYMALKSVVAREVEKGEELISQGTPKNQVIAKRIAALAEKNTKNEGETAIDVGVWTKDLTAE